MCEVTWNTWEICGRSWCQCMRHHALKILRFCSLSLPCCQLVSSSLDFPCFDVRTQVLSLRPSHGHLHDSCVLWALFLISSTSPFTSSPSSSSLWSPCPSFCLPTSSSRMWSTTTLRTSAEDLSTLAENEPSAKCTIVSDKRSARLISHTLITQTITDNGVMWETQLNTVCWVYSKTHFVGDFEDSKSVSESVPCIIQRWTLVPTMWMCKERTSVLEINYHLRENDYSFDALQTHCFQKNI